MFVTTRNLFRIYKGLYYSDYTSNRASQDVYTVKYVFHMFTYKGLKAKEC